MIMAGFNSAGKTYSVEPNKNAVFVADADVNSATASLQAVKRPQWNR